MIHNNFIESTTIKKEDFRSISEDISTDKFWQHRYDFIYPKFLDQFRSDKFKLLEIGYFQGLSAQLWKRYFPHAEIFIIDRDTEIETNYYKCLKADQSKLEDLQNVKNLIQSAKLIIDDGSHHPRHQYDTFEYLFQNLLEPGGVYIIEDIECNYWKSDSTIYGYEIGNFSAVEESKSLIDIINSEFSLKTNNFQISSITYSQNCIIITKKTQEELIFFNRRYRFPEALRS
jgi:hypothetical protein